MKFKRNMLVILIIVCIFIGIGSASAGDVNETVAVDSDLQQDEKISEETPDVFENDKTEEMGSEEDDAINDFIDALLSFDEANTVKVDIYKQTGKTTKDKKVYIKVTDPETGKGVKTKFDVFIFKSSVKPDVDDFNWEWYKTVKTDSNGIGVFTWAGVPVGPGTYNVVLDSFEDYTSSWWGDYDIAEGSTLITKVVVKTKLSLKVKKSKGTLEIFVKKNKKPINKIKLKIKIFTGRKYKTIYLTSAKIKHTKLRGYCAFSTNALKIGKHKVVITSANKKYYVSKTSSFKITKDMKKDPSFLFTVSKGKLYQYGFL